MRIPLSAVDLDGNEARYAADAIATGWISGTGSYLRRFEAAVAEATERQHVVAVNSGTSALELALLALGVRPGDEVIVPALTFVAPAASVAALGAIPVLCDVSRRDWTIDVAAAARLVTPRTKAVIAVDVLGHPSDYNALASLGIPIIEDAAEAHGARYGGHPVGSFGVASILSFHANKAISTGEGGSVGCDSAELAATVRLLASHAMTRERPYWHDYVGRSYKMTNVTAGIGVGQCERWADLIEGRNRVAALYDRLLAGTHVGLRPVHGACETVCWLYTAVIPQRDAVVDQMRRAGIDARAIWPALSELPLYQAGLREPCLVAEEVAASAAWLPTWANMPDSLVFEVAAELRRALEAVVRL
jgi:perosamine synthetase